MCRKAELFKSNELNELSLSFPVDIRIFESRLKICYPAMAKLYSFLNSLISLHWWISLCLYNVTRLVCCGEECFWESHLNGEDKQWGEMWNSKVHLVEAFQGALSTFEWVPFSLIDPKIFHPFIQVALVWKIDTQSFNVSRLGLKSICILYMPLSTALAKALSELRLETCNCF